MRILKSKIAAAIVALLSVGCTTDNYDSGDGNLSYITADFVLLHTDSNACNVSADTDDNKHLTLSNPFQSEWTHKADSSYRALLYYDVTNDVKKATSTDNNANGTVNDCVVRMRSIRQVPVLMPTTAERVADINDSPLNVESIWISTNKSFVNMTLLLKSGKTDNNSAIHTIALVRGDDYTDASGKRHASLRLVHDQGNVPQYYTVKQYVSVPTSCFVGIDSLDITIHNTSTTTTRVLSL